MLPGMNAAMMVGGGGPSFDLMDTDITQNNTNTPSFSSMDAGVPNAGRVLIAVISCYDGTVIDATFWPATCTIGGVTANNRASHDAGGGGNSVGAAIYSVTVPNGTTATVALTAAFSGTMDDWACALFRAVGVSETPLSVDDASSGGVTLNTSSARFVLVAASDQGDNPIGSFSGGGNIAEAVLHNRLVVAYDDTPLGGTTDNYNTATTANAYAGAAFG